MTILEELASPQAWEAFYTNRVENGRLTRSEARFLRAYIDQERYLSAVRAVEEGALFDPPRKYRISKSGSEKKRVIYTYSADDNQALKFITHCLLKRYDGLFSNSLYSFRAHRGVAPALRRLYARRDLPSLYVYKADIHDYFNSVDVARLVPMVREVLAQEGALCDFLCALLTDDRAVEEGKLIHEQKGIMAGTPVAAFYANLYLNEMDRAFEGRLYFRYSDDILILTSAPQARDECAARVHAFLDQYALSINPEKESTAEPGQRWSFLGFDFENGRVDVAEHARAKLKAKMRRKARALERWRKRKGATGEQAARAFIRVFNRRFFEAAEEDDLNWSRWYFPLVNTDAGLREIDRYMQQCIRAVVTGKHNKGAFACRYEDMKRLGYRSLVHEYYEYRAGRAEKEEEP